MEVPPASLAEVSQLYQAAKSIALELIAECHDPDYETTMENVRRAVSAMEEEMFQLKLFDLKPLAAAV